jgi:hypothetical protein
MNLDIVKKTRRSPNSIESSSSEEMERSKPPKDVLGLGRHIVRELKLKDRGDTLGLWMAHYVAGLIREAETEKSAARRKRAGKEATEAILNIWEHRESLPSHAFPLARYDALFRVLDRLQPSDNPFRYGQNPGTKIDRLAIILFDSLSRLIVCLLLMGPLSLRKAEMLNEAVLEALTEDERNVWDALQKWTEIFVPKSALREYAEDSEAQTEGPAVDFKEVALDLITRIKEEIEELQKELAERDVDPSGLPKSKAVKRARKRGPKRK